MALPNVTIAVVPRERFSHTRETLESIYAHTTYPFSLVCVDGNSPPKVRAYLERQAETKGFQVVRSDRYLSPNQARNLALERVETPYVVFIDNDVVVTPGWLETLMDCAAETRATVVCPLVCIGEPVHETIHLAGGEARIVVENCEKRGIHRRIHEKHYFVNRPVAEVRDRLVRQPCEFAEFHCMLVRREVFQKLGPLDEKLLSTREHIDFCLNVTHAGGSIYCEPNAVATYVTGSLQLSDLPFFFLRWSDEWERLSLKRFRKKWDLTKKNKYFKKRQQRLGFRRHQAFLKPFVRRLLFGLPGPWLTKALIPWERRLNRWVSQHYAPEWKSSPQVTLLQPESVRQ